jgi:hypothetical protein
LDKTDGTTSSHQILKQDAMASTQNQTNASQVFAIVQQISSHINKDRIQDIVDNAKNLDIEQNQLVVDILAMVRSYPAPM